MGPFVAAAPAAAVAPAVAAAAALQAVQADLVELAGGAGTGET